MADEKVYKEIDRVTKDNIDEFDPDWLKESLDLLSKSRYDFLKKRGQLSAAGKYVKSAGAAAALLHQGIAAGIYEVVVSEVEGDPGKERLTIVETTLGMLALKSYDIKG